MTDRQPTVDDASRLEWYRAESKRLQAEVDHWKYRAEQWEAEAEKMTKKYLEAGRLLEQSERMVKA
jgi:hypothetical protein